jgi:hypothetical protein
MMLKDAYSEYYTPSEYLVATEVTILFKGRIIFRHYISNVHMCYRITIYKLCDMSSFTYEVGIY